MYFEIKCNNQACKSTFSIKFEFLYGKDSIRCPACDSYMAPITFKALERAAKALSDFNGNNSDWGINVNFCNIPNHETQKLQSVIKTLNKLYENDSNYEK